MLRKIISFLISFCFLFEQVGFAQIAGQLDISGRMSSLIGSVVYENYRPIHLRYLFYDQLNNNFKMLLDKGNIKEAKPAALERATNELLKYFFIGISLPDEVFWVNLRPDSPQQIIDDDLAKTDMGKIMLEADLQLKKDTARFTSPETFEGREYWDKLYKKAEELFASQNVTIPTLTRPWIVPDEIIVREAQGSAYIYKATLKVMLEQDYLKGNPNYRFPDERSRQLNEYSSQIIRETIIPKLTREINSSKRYAPLRQVYYSLILAQWFKDKHKSDNGKYSRKIDNKDLANLRSNPSWNKDSYFKAYQKSFKDGEYNIKENRPNAYGQTIRSYFSGGMALQLLGQIKAGLIQSGAELGPVLRQKYSSFTLSDDGAMAIEQQPVVGASSQSEPASKKDGGNIRQDEWIPKRDKVIDRMIADLFNREKIEGQISEQKIKSFEKVYRNLPGLAQRIAEEYRKLAKGRDIGKIEIYIVGGRPRGEPLKESSDIDLIVAVENDARKLGLSEEEYWKATGAIIFNIIEEFKAQGIDLPIRLGQMYSRRLAGQGGQEGFEFARQLNEYYDNLRKGSAQPESLLKISDYVWFDFQGFGIKLESQNKKDIEGEPGKPGLGIKLAEDVTPSEGMPLPGGGLSQKQIGQLIEEALKTRSEEAVSRLRKAREGYPGLFQEQVNNLAKKSGNLKYAQEVEDLLAGKSQKITEIIKGLVLGKLQGSPEENARLIAARRSEAKQFSDRLEEVKKMENAVAREEEMLYLLKTATADQAAMIFIEFLNQGNFSRMVEVYESFADPQFRDNTIIYEYYLVALNKVGRTKDVIAAIKAMPAEKWQQIQNGEIYGAMGRAYKDMYSAADSLLSELEKPESQRDQQALAGKIREYKKRFSLDPATTVEEIAGNRAAVAEARKKSLQDCYQAYLNGFLLDFDYYPGVNAVYTLFWLANLEELEGNQAQAKKMYEQAKRLADMTFFSSNKDKGKESQDYWFLVTMLELSILRATGDVGESLDKVLAVINNREDLWMINSTLESLQKTRAISVLDQAVIKTVIDRLQERRRQIESGEQIHKQPSAPQDEQSRLQERFYSLSGLNSNFVSGALYVEGATGFGGALRASAITKWDIEVARELLKQLGLEGEQDFEKFDRAVNDALARRFRTAELQDLHGPFHAVYDNIQLALNALFDVYYSRDSKTNIMLSYLMRIGDCRHQATVKQLLFELWKTGRINAYMKEAHAALLRGDAGSYAEYLDKVRALARTQLYIMDVEVRAPVDMSRGLYNPVIENNEFVARDKLDDQSSPIEEHTLNVLGHYDENGKLVRLELRDSFYRDFKQGNKRLNPYNFGSYDTADGTKHLIVEGGDLRELLENGWEAGEINVAVKDQDGNIIRHEKRTIRLTPTVYARFDRRGKDNSRATEVLIAGMAAEKPEDLPGLLAGDAYESVREQLSAFGAKIDAFDKMRFWNSNNKFVDAQSIFRAITASLAAIVAAKAKGEVSLSELAAFSVEGIEGILQQIRKMPWLAEKFHQGYYQPLRAQVDSLVATYKTSPLIDPRIFISSFNRRTANGIDLDKLVELLDTDLPEVRKLIERGNFPDAKIKLGVRHIKAGKIEAFYRLAKGIAESESLPQEVADFIKKQEELIAETDRLSAAGASKEEIDRARAKEAVIVNTLQMPWSDLIIDAEETYANPQARKEVLVALQEKAIILAVALLKDKTFFADTPTASEKLDKLLDYFHAGWSRDNSWDPLAKMSLEQLRLTGNITKDWTTVKEMIFRLGLSEEFQDILIEGARRYDNAGENSGQKSGGDTAATKGPVITRSLSSVAGQIRQAPAGSPVFVDFDDTVVSRENGNRGFMYPQARFFDMRDKMSADPLSEEAVIEEAIYLEKLGIAAGVDKEVEGIRDIINAAKEIGSLPIIITNRPESLREATVAVLESLGIKKGQDYRDIIFAGPAPNRKAEIISDYVKERGQSESEVFFIDNLNGNAQRVWDALAKIIPRSKLRIFDLEGTEQQEHSLPEFGSRLAQLAAEGSQQARAEWELAAHGALLQAAQMLIAAPGDPAIIESVNVFIKNNGLDSFQQGFASKFIADIRALQSQKRFDSGLDTDLFKTKIAAIDKLLGKIIDFDLESLKDVPGCELIGKLLKYLGANKDQNGRAVSQALVKIARLIEEAQTQGKISRSADLDLNSFAEKIKLDMDKPASDGDVRIQDVEFQVDGQAAQPQKVTIKTYPMVLELIIREFVLNAIKKSYSAEEIESGRNKQDLKQIRIALNLLSKENKVQIKVMDQGVGMDEETRNRVFSDSSIAGSKPEVKLRSIFQSTNLGLSFVRDFSANILESEAYALSAGSGQGSEFGLTLPLSNTKPLADKYVEPIAQAIRHDIRNNLIAPYAVLTMMQNSELQAYKGLNPDAGEAIDALKEMRDIWVEMHKMTLPSQQKDGGSHDLEEAWDILSPVEKASFQDKMIRVNAADLRDIQQGLVITAKKQDGNGQIKEKQTRLVFDFGKDQVIIDGQPYEVRYTKGRLSITLDSIFLVKGSKIASEKSTNLLVRALGVDEQALQINLSQFIANQLGLDTKVLNENFTTEIGFLLVYNTQTQKYRIMHDTVENGFELELSPEGRVKDVVTYIKPSPTHQLLPFEEIVAEGHFHPVGDEFLSAVDLAHMVNRARAQGKVIPEVIATFQQITSEEDKKGVLDAEKPKKQALVLVYYKFEYNEINDVVKALNELVMQSRNSGTPIYAPEMAELLEKVITTRQWIEKALPDGGKQATLGRFDQANREISGAEFIDRGEVSRGTGGKMMLYLKSGAPLAEIETVDRKLKGELRIKFLPQENEADARFIIDHKLDLFKAAAIFAAHHKKDENRRNMGLSGSDAHNREYTQKFFEIFADQSLETVLTENAVFVNGIPMAVNKDGQAVLEADGGNKRSPTEQDYADSAIKNFNQIFKNAKKTERILGDRVTVSRESTGGSELSDEDVRQIMFDQDLVETLKEAQPDEFRKLQQRLREIDSPASNTDGGKTQISRMTAQDTEKILKTWDLQNSSWLGDLLEKIAQDYNHGRPLKNADDPGAQDEEYVYLAKVDPTRKIMAPSSSEKPGDFETAEAVFYSVVVAKKASLDNALKASVLDVSQVERDILFTFKCTFQHLQGAPYIRIIWDKMAMSQGLQNQGYGGKAFLNFAESAKKYFPGAVIRSEFIDEAASAIFRKNFESAYFLRQRAFANQPLSLRNSEVLEAIVPDSPNKPGGIDFRALPIANQPGALPAGTNLLPAINIADLDREWQEIQTMAESEMVPSTQRLKEFLGACCSKGALDKYAGEVLACIADILRLEEAKAKATEPALRDILILLESNRPDNELQQSLSFIEVAAGEPQA